MTESASFIWVYCRSCQHKWIAVHLPMELNRSLKIMNRLICPKCAADLNDIFVCDAPEEGN